MKTFLPVRWWIALLALLASQLPLPAFGDEPKVYFEKECLAVFSNHTATSQRDNETRVEEGRGLIRFEKTIVTETRDGVSETYIQVRDCHVLERAVEAR